MGLFDAPENRSFVSSRIFHRCFSQLEEGCKDVIRLGSELLLIQVYRTDSLSYPLFMPSSFVKLAIKCAKQLGVPFKSLSDEEKAKKEAEGERKKKGESTSCISISRISSSVQQCADPLSLLIYLFGFPVETFMSFQEKLDDIKRLQAEIQVAKLNAVQVSPGVFGVGGIGSPGLNLGPEGLAGLAQRGGTDLATAQARLSKWLTGIDPIEIQNMSQERQLMVKQYMQMEQYLVSYLFTTM